MQWNAASAKYIDRATAIGEVHAPVAISLFLYNFQAVSVLLYLAQLVPLPKEFMTHERKALHKVFHFATNALTMASFLNMGDYNGPKIRSLACSAAAALFRMSCSFESSWRAWLPQLEQTAIDHSSLFEISQERYSPSFWDSLPFVVNLSRSFQGKLNGLAGMAAIAETRHELDESQNVSFNLSADRHFREQPKLAVQKVAYQAHLRNIYPSDLDIVLQRRLKSTLGDAFSQGGLDSALQCLGRLPTHEVVQVLKTWSNSWATSHRFHESQRLPCLLGCESGLDSLVHYAFCPVIRDIVCQKVGLPGTWPGIDKLGTSSLSEVSLKCIACVYYAYHAVKFSSEVRSAVRTAAANSGDVVSSTLVVDSATTISIFSGAFSASADLAGLSRLAFQ